MCSRIIRNVLPLTFQIAKAAAAQSSKHFRNITLHAPFKAVLPNTCLSRRLYSEQVKIEEMIVDYDYVKKVTSDQNVLIIDVREPDEIKEHGKIPNSVNIPLGSVTSILSSMPENEFQKTYQRLKPSEETEIIFYCMIGKRSGMAQQNAHNLGYKKVALSEIQNVEHCNTECEELFGQLDRLGNETTLTYL